MVSVKGKRREPEITKMFSTKSIFNLLVNMSIWFIFFLVWLIKAIVNAVRTRVLRYDPSHTVPQLLTMQGYTCSTFRVTTEDGYLLTLFRVSSQSSPNPTTSSSPQSSTPRPVALFWHGLLDSAYTWTFLNKQSLALQLVDAGYDVWLGNNRGNKYSQAHAFLNPAENDFWQFTWDDFAQFDLPNSVDFILNETQAPSLAYIGHSEGTTQMFAKLCLDPAFSSKLACYVAMGPVASVQNVRGFFYLLAQLRVDKLVWHLGYRKKIFSPDSYVSSLLGVFCDLFPLVVDDSLRILCGKPKQPMSPALLSDWGDHEPGGTSILNMAHWAQAMRRTNTPGPTSPSSPPSTCRFTMFDYGTRENTRRYGQPTPPNYDLGRFPASLPVLLCAGSVDTLATPKDVQWLRLHLGASTNVQSIALDGYDHTDYLWSPDAPKTLYPQIIPFLNKYAAKTIAKSVARAHERGDDAEAEGRLPA